MRFIRSFLYTVVFLLLSDCHVEAQKTRVDSLIQWVSQYAQPDSTSIQHCIDISDYFLRIDVKKASEYAQKALSLASQSEKYPNLNALSHSRLGTVSYLQKKYRDAVTHYNQALVINTRRSNERQIASNLNNLGLVYAALDDYSEAVNYYLKALDINEKLDNKIGIVNNLGNIGSMYNYLEQPKDAAGYFEKALELSKYITNENILANLYNNLGNSYTNLDEYEKALQFKLKALEISRKSNDRNRISIFLSNIGNIYLRLNDFDKANNYYLEAKGIQEELKDDKSLISTYLGMGEVYSSLDNYDLAKSYYFKSLKKAEDTEDLKMQAACFGKLSLLYSGISRPDSALYYYKQEINLRNKIDLTKRLSEISLISMRKDFSKIEDSLIREQLFIDSKLREQILISENQKKELELKEAELLIKQKVSDLQTSELLRQQTALDLAIKTRSEREKQLQLAEKEKLLKDGQIRLQEADITLKQNELQKQKSIRAYILSLMMVLVVVLILIFRGFRYQKKTNKIINAERAKSDGLLLNILPEHVAAELKENGYTTPVLYDDTTVLFTDFVGFTAISESMQPKELLEELNYYFTSFDNIVKSYHMEKIKTIGDAYMAVAGLNKPLSDPAEDAVNAALDMRDFIMQRKNLHQSKFSIRIGLHKGKLIAGVVGTNKFAYDVWGDTVNTASRMESTGVAGKVNVSETIYESLKDKFKFEDRGMLSVKNKADMRMYLVERKN